VESQLDLWLHLLAFAVYTGATAALLALLPSGRRDADPHQHARFAAAILRMYDPLSIGALGVLIMTGAFCLTPYKDALRGAFFARLGTVMAWKLGLTFVLVNLAAYIAFGLGHRLVRAVDADEPVDPAWSAAVIRKLRIATVAALLLVAAIVWIAMRITPALAAPGVAQ